MGSPDPKVCVFKVVDFCSNSAKPNSCRQDIPPSSTPSMRVLNVFANLGHIFVLTCIFWSISKIVLFFFFTSWSLGVMNVVKTQITAKTMSANL